MILSEKKYLSMANAIRMLSADAVEKANSGHPGMPLGMADVATILFSEFLKFNPEDPRWPNRDRFILSAGHGSMLLYSLLYLTGYTEMPLEEIKNFRQLGSKTAGHPEHEILEAVETSTGPLGQGIANGVGMAIAEQIMSARYGTGVTDHYTYAIAGDGCLMEGISLEAASLAGHLKLGKLIILFDDNHISIDGSTDLTTSDDHLKRFEAQGWHTIAIDGHNYSQIREAISAAKTDERPSLIACKTKIGFGTPTKEGNAASHGAPLGTEEIKGLRKKLDWNYPPFEIPEEILTDWRNIYKRNVDEYNKWQNIKKPEEFTRTTNGNFPKNWIENIDKFKQQLAENTKQEATRKSSGNVLEILAKDFPELIGGSADLSGSNNTKVSAQRGITKDNFDGNYIYYGVREHAMGAIMNGLALYKGFIPYGGTFLVFSDYCRPAIRLSALMKQRVIYVMTHDSIGVGEDGPTHQPVEHLPSLRAIPNLNVFRPADATETLECWQLAMESLETPSLLSLTRQNLPQIRNEYTKDNLSSKGAYIISEAEGNLDVTIFATGSEVSIALEAQEKLRSNNIRARVVSVPCAELFFKQDKEYITNILCNNSIKVAVEAALEFGWQRFIGSHGIFVGMNDFGASAPGDILYKHFKITTDEIVSKVLSKVKE